MSINSLLFLYIASPFIEIYKTSWTYGYCIHRNTKEYISGYEWTANGLDNNFSPYSYNIIVLLPNFERKDFEFVVTVVFRDSLVFAILIRNPSTMPL